MSSTGETETATAPELVVSIRGLSKTYRQGKALMPIPLPSLRPGEGQSRRIRAADDGVLSSDDEDDEADGVDEDDEAEERADRPAGLIHALADINLDIEAGTAIALIGPNGSGKSTLLKILARIAPPTAGRVALNGRVAPMLGLSKVVMNVEATGRENVHLVARFYDVPREIVARRMAEVMRFAGLEGHEDQLGKTYSSGMWRRLAFSIVLNLEPDILLADEELVVGDAAFREHCIAGVENAIASGLTMLFASHDMELIRHLCTEALWLESGQVKARGPVEEITAAYEAEYGTAIGGASAAIPSGATGLEGQPRKSARDERVSIGTAVVASTDGAVVSSIRSNEPILMEAGLDVYREGVELQCVLSLTAKGVARLIARQPEPFRAPGCGRYLVSAFVPGDSLPDGVYRGRVAVSVFEDGERTLVDRKDAFSLDVEGIGPPVNEGETVQLDEASSSVIWDVQPPDRVG